MNPSFPIQSLQIHFAPVLDPIWLWGIGLVGCGLLLISLQIYHRGSIVRSVAFVVFMLALLNPSLITEERHYVKDVGVVVLDESLSQTLDNRDMRASAALNYLEETLKDNDSIDYRIIKAPKDGRFAPRTDLFSALDNAISDVPEKRRAGIVFITDGRIHDVPKDEVSLTSYGPVHALLTGRKDEKDRRITVTNAPAYGLVGKTVTLKYRVEDTANIHEKAARVTLTLHDGTVQNYTVPVGEEYSVSLPLNHASENIFTLSVDHIDDELTYANNKTAVVINGVRDRLKVLLVSGIPHPGERTWRDLLTSDPGVDLVHFTILREPDKFDYTPKNELSLIAFPFRELFEEKLYDFDLIIFDRYRANNILPNRYFENIVRYVREGGAFLEASGPAFAGRQSIYDTPLGEILPARPTGDIIEKAYYPHITATGQNHPVTQSLVWAQKTDTKTTSDWGKWLRYINIEPMRGDILMSALNERPLIVLDRVEKGRVAQISSDHIWLWSKGYDGGGPHAELLRRIIHWLMKEPELDERAMDVSVYQNKIIIKKRPIHNAQTETIAMTTPNGDVRAIDLILRKSGFLEHTIMAKDIGIYAFEDSFKTRKLAMIGQLDTPEINGVTTTVEELYPLIKASGGTSIYLDDIPSPTVHFIEDSSRYGGKDWIAFKRNNDYTVSAVRDAPLLPEWAILLILLLVLSYSWWAEGRQK